MIIATMNVFDKALLFEMSFALMRRFAFVEVAVPDHDDFHQLLLDRAPTPEIGALAVPFLGVRKYKERRRKMTSS